MARGDVISDHAVTVGNGVEVDVQPAAGDEWLISALLADSAPWNFKGTDGTDDTAALFTGLFGGTTTPPQNYDDIGLNPIELLLTNTHRILMQNDSGSEKDFMFSGVKIKE